MPKIPTWLFVSIIGVSILLIVVAIYYNRRKTELAKQQLKAAQIAGIGGFEIKIGGIGEDISENFLGIFG